MSLTRAGIALFMAAVAFGPLYTVPGYSMTQHVISQLAAQHTPGNGIMATAFVLLGTAIVVDGLRAPRRRQAWPFIAFGLAFALAGLFGHRPIAPDVPYSAAVDAAHSALATVSGTALTIGFAWQALRRSASMAHRAVAAAMALVCLGLPLLMLAHPAVQGLIQRAMYALVFAWLWSCYPRRLQAG